MGILSRLDVSLSQTEGFSGSARSALHWSPVQLSSAFIFLYDAVLIFRSARLLRISPETRSFT
jgi:hypothetical protein